MAGEKKLKECAALITKALLLGYTFEDMATGQVCCVSPSRGVGIFPARWLAAKAALEHAGVPYDAKKPSGDTGVGSGARYRLRGRQRLRGSTSCVPEGAGAGRERKKV